MSEKDKIILGSAIENVTDATVDNSGTAIAAASSIAATGALTSADTLALSVAGLSFAWALSKALLGSAMKLRQQTALEWVEMIRDNPSIFTREILETKDFQYGFIVAFEDYLKIRSDLKRAMARKIFKGFATSSDKEHFYLEAYNQALRTISSEAIELLGYINSELREKQHKSVQKELELYDLKNTQFTKAQLLEIITPRHPLSIFFEEYVKDSAGDQAIVWIPSKPNPQYPSITGSAQVAIPNHKRTQKYELIDELSNLGILKVSVYIGNAENANRPVANKSWDLSNFGEGFVTFLKR